MISRTRPLQRRAERLDLYIPVVFVGEGGLVRGNCLNLSESGLLGAFGSELHVRSEGELRFSAGALCHAQRVRVTRTKGQEAGLVFLFHHQMERQAIAQLLAIARRTPSQAATLPLLHPLHGTGAGWTGTLRQ